MIWSFDRPVTVGGCPAEKMADFALKHFDQFITEGDKALMIELDLFSKLTIRHLAVPVSYNHKFAKALVNTTVKTKRVSVPEPTDPAALSRVGHILKGDENCLGVGRALPHF
ncbi:MAG: hypothetical protein AB8B62_03015 [Roseobacter sp.]